MACEKKQMSGRTPDVRLTPKQLELYVFLIRELERTGIIPSQADIAAKTNRSRTAVRHLLGKLNEKGYITLSPSGDDRAIKINHIRIRVEVIEDDGR